MKMKFGQILVCSMTSISNMFLMISILEDWKLVSGPFMILLKWQYSKTCPFLMIYIYHFNRPLLGRGVLMQNERPCT